MEMIQSVIEGLGFPVAMVCAFGYFILRKDQQAMDDKNKLYEELAQNREERKHFVEVLNKFNIRFEAIETKVDTVSDKVDKIKIE